LRFDKKKSLHAVARGAQLLTRIFAFSVKSLDKELTFAI
jgi:hypothetical protein